MKCSIKKISAFIISAAISISAFALTAAAEENIQAASYNDNYSVSPRAALPAGAYYSTSNPNSFIQIDSGNDTTCLVNLVIYDSNGNKISGTGYYNYRLNAKFNIILTSWYKIKTNGSVEYGSGDYFLNVTYSGGAIIIDNTGEEFKL